MFLTGQAEIEKAIHRINSEVSMLPEGSAGPLLALPLHASLPPELQVTGKGGRRTGGSQHRKYVSRWMDEGISLRTGPNGGLLVTHFKLMSDLIIGL